jgi:hypothetical protein
LLASKIPRTTDALISFRDQTAAMGSKNFDGILRTVGNGHPSSIILASPMFRQPMHWTLPNDVPWLVDILMQKPELRVRIGFG